MVLLMSRNPYTHPPSSAAQTLALAAATEAAVSPLTAALIYLSKSLGCHNLPAISREEGTDLDTGHVVVGMQCMMWR